MGKRCISKCSFVAWMKNNKPAATVLLQEPEDLGLEILEK